VTIKAHDAAILGVDTAAVSGVAVRVRGRLMMSCEVRIDRPEEVTEVVTYLGRVAERAGLPIGVVLERPWGGPSRTVEGLGVARGSWLTALQRAGYPKGKVVSVMPNTWRSAVFGGHWVRAKRDDIRAHELGTARVEAGRPDIGSDEAAAIWISYWACYSDEVRARLGKRGR